MLEFEFKYFSREHAAEHIAVLVEADKRGHYSHGFNRLRGHYVADIRSKVLKVFIPIISLNLNFQDL